MNVAARLEQAADPGDILVGTRAAELVAGAFEFAAPTRVEAKGKTGGVECRRLLRALSLMRPRGVPGLRPVFVGRDRDLELLRAAHDRACVQQEPQLVTIMGEAGVGKTRLVRETWEKIGLESPETLRRTGRCQPHGHAWIYGPIGEFLQEQFGILESDTPDQVLGRLGEREILGLALGLDVTRELHPIEARDRLHDAWIEVVAEIAAEQPLALLVEDLHWAEQPLLELLERMLLELHAPVLLLATGRPEFLDRSPTWGRGRAPSEWIWLEPLGSDDVERWLQELVAADAPLPVQELLGRAEGNPLFLEELLGTLIERGALRGDAWDETLVPVETAVPDTVQAMLAARIDLLPAEEKAALQAAAVIGRVFWPSPVRELLKGAEPDFHLLERRDFVRRRPGASLDGEHEFVFKHALTRDVAYGSLTRRERAHLHADFASWLERRGGGRDEHAASLAHHYAEAVRPEDVDLAWGGEPDRHEELRTRAVAWLRRAAQLAAGRYEVEEALALLESALEIEPDARARIELFQETAWIHVLCYDMESFRSAMESALALEPDRGAAAEIYAHLAFRARGRPYMWKTPPDRELGEQWLARALELSEPDSSARGWALMAQALSDPSKRVEAAQKVHRLGVALGEPRLVVFATEARGLAATEAGRYQEACDWADRGLAAAPQLANPNHEAQQYWHSAFIYARAGRFAEARAFAEVHDRIVSSLTAHEEVHGVGLRLAIESALGEWEVLAALMGRAEAASAGNEDFPCQFNWRNLLVCALGVAHLGDERQARRLEEIGRASAVVGGPAEVEPALLRLALLRGDEQLTRGILEASPAMLGPWGIDVAAARLDAWLTLGERERIEEEAAPFLEEESYTQAFALRALGVIRARRVASSCRRSHASRRWASAGARKRHAHWRASHASPGDTVLDSARNLEEA